MDFLRYFLRELKWLSEVVIEELYLLWSETALCGDVPRGGETCREFGVGTSVTLGLKIADVGENNLRRVGRGHGRNEELGMKSVIICGQKNSVEKKAVILRSKP